jgi:hypothetical protein
MNSGKKRHCLLVSERLTEQGAYTGLVSQRHRLFEQTSLADAGRPLDDQYTPAPLRRCGNRNRWARALRGCERRPQGRSVIEVDVWHNPCMRQRQLPVRVTSAETSRRAQHQTAPEGRRKALTLRYLSEVFGRFCYAFSGS